MDVEPTTAVYDTSPTIYEIVLAHDGIEIPQLKSSSTVPWPITRLVSTGAYVVDTVEEVFVWIGQKTSGLLKQAAPAIASQIYDICARPDWAYFSTVYEHSEPFRFRIWFKGWSTRCEKSLEKRPSKEVKVNLSALFQPYQYLRNCQGQLKHSQLDGVTVIILSL
jgi:hypothetical protein